MYLLLPHQIQGAELTEIGEPRVQDVKHHINEKEFTDEWDLPVSDMQPIFETAELPLAKRKVAFAYFAASTIKTDENNQITHATGRWLQLVQHIYLPKSDGEGFTLPIDIPPLGK